MTIELDDVIEYLFREGRTLESIGALFHITRERVRKILEARGVDGDTARIMRSMNVVMRREAARRATWDKRCIPIYGCTHDVAISLNGGLRLSRPGSKAATFIKHRGNALRRGIPWNLTFSQWINVWEESGKYGLRGRGKDKYVMARIGDSGAYEVGNVEIITSAQNVRDSFLVNPISKRIAMRSWHNPHNDPTYMTPRVKQAAELLQQGKNYREIAGILKIDKRNAWQYVDYAKRKLALIAEIQGKAA